MRFDSPLRYPGGKTSLAGFLARTIKLNGLYGCPYYEPFAGGAGAALHLLRNDVVSELHLNDLDPCIASFWRAVLDEPERFAEAILTVPLSIAEWRRQQQVSLHPASADTFELGFAAFYLNRCNRSGIIRGAAPIGGYAQAGKWRIDARFYRNRLVERVWTIASQRAKIHVTNMDARDFLVEYLPNRNQRNPIFAYLDPPYFAKGNRLYLNSYQERDHQSLARYIQGQNRPHWLMSYDDTAFIRNLYPDCQISHVSLDYSLQLRQSAQELLISPPHVMLPDEPRLTNGVNGHNG